MVTVAQTPPAPKALLSPAQVLPSSCPSPAVSYLLPPAPPLSFCSLELHPPVDLGTSHYAHIHLPKPHTLPEAREWKMQENEEMEAKSQGHRGGQPSLANNPALSHYGLGAAKDLDGLGKLFLMVANMATLGRGLSCYSSFSKKMESGLFWAGGRTSDPKAGQSRPGPRGKAVVHPYSQVRVAALPVPALPTCGCERPPGAAQPCASGQSLAPGTVPPFLRG